MALVPTADVDQEDRRPLNGNHHPSAPTANSSSFFFVNYDNINTPPPSYPWLLFFHAIALVPTVIFIVVYAVLALRSKCHLPLSTHHYDHDHHPHDSLERCANTLGSTSSLSWTLVGLSVVLYIAMHKTRSLAAKTAHVIFGLARHLTGFAAEIQRDPMARDEDSRAAIILSCLVKALITEAFKAGLFMLATAVVVAQVQMMQYELPEPADDGKLVFIASAGDFNPLADAIRWSMLDPRESRLRIAVWLVLGWTVSEFVRGTVQLFGNLAMYAPVYLSEEEEDEEEGEDIDAAAAAKAAATRVAAAEHSVVADTTYGDDDVDSNDSVISDIRQHKNPTDYDVVAPTSPTMATSPAGTKGKGKAPTSIVVTNDYRGPANATIYEEAADVSQGAVPGSNTKDVIVDDGDGDDESELSMIMHLEEQIDRLVAARTRVKMEQALGATLPELPTALAALWRLDAALWSVGSFLLLSSSIALGQGPLLSPHSQEGLTPLMAPPFSSFYIVFILLAALHAGFNIVWSLALSSWGWPAVTYTSLLVGIAMMVMGLARWGLVV